MADWSDASASVKITGQVIHAPFINITNVQFIINDGRVLQSDFKSTIGPLNELNTLTSITSGISELMVNESDNGKTITMFITYTLQGIEYNTTSIPVSFDFYGSFQSMQQFVML